MTPHETVSTTTPGDARATAPLTRTFGPQGPTLGALSDAYLQDYQVRQFRSHSTARGRVAHLTAFFGRAAREARVAAWATCTRRRGEENTAQAHTAERRRDAGVSPRDADAGESRRKPWPPRHPRQGSDRAPSLGSARTTGATARDPRRGRRCASGGDRAGPRSRCAPPATGGRATVSAAWRRRIAGCPHLGPAGSPGAGASRPPSKAQ